jgi:hypothetical protein
MPARHSITERRLPAYVVEAEVLLASTAAGLLSFRQPTGPGVLHLRGLACYGPSTLDKELAKRFGDGFSRVIPDVTWQPVPRDMLRLLVEISKTEHLTADKTAKKARSTDAPTKK